MTNRIEVGSGVLPGLIELIAADIDAIQLRDNPLALRGVLIVS